MLTSSERAASEKKHVEKRNLLKIPRRPKWTTETTAGDLHLLENQSFLEWRRGLALLQEDDGILLTPYERNIEFWRQLWRVVERSDVIIQIVDARNPLLFRSADLERYVKEVGDGKLNMVLVNKADFLSDEQRATWANWFDKQNIKVAFFSAVLTEEENKRIAAEEKLKEENAEQEIEQERAESNEKSLDLSDLKEAAHELENAVNKAEQQLSAIETKIGVPSKNNPNILGRLELIQLFKTMHVGAKVTPNVTTIGMVGYPNVGKSSTINSLIIEKKVSVSATPGKTKHFQTLFLDTDLLLCDCPGLVMPSFVLTKADMILNGILPIDQMRDHVPAVNNLCTRIPRHILEDKYGIMIAKPPEGEDPSRPPYSEELLLAYGCELHY